MIFQSLKIVRSISARDSQKSGCAAEFPDISWGRAWIGAALLVSAFAHGDTISLPHQQRPGSSNLLDNQCANFSTPQTGNGQLLGISGWTIDDTATDAEYEPLVSRGSGSGSIKFPNASGLTPDIPKTDTTPFIAGSYAGRVRSCRISNSYFEYDKPYTVGFFVHSSGLPAYVSVLLHFYDANGVLSYTVRKLAVASSTDWQEAVNVFTITDHNIVQVQVVIDAVYTGASRPDIYVDDVYLGPGISFVEPPTTTRQTFNGNKVKIDKLGNWQTYNTTTSAWEDFFPFGLYPDLGRGGYQPLSDKGFNLVMSQQFASQVQYAKSAISPFNPKGMRAGLRMATYAIPGHSYWTLPRLGDTREEIAANALDDTLLFYDWDNENNWSTWAHWTDMVNVLRTGDTNQDGIPDHDTDTDHPIYILNGYPAVQPRFTALSDVVGTYVDFDRTRDGGGGLDVLQNLERQTTPVSIAQINDVEEAPYAFRLRVYDALIKGARGIVYWGDGDTRVPVESRRIENRSWWSYVPALRTEIDKLKPILRQPHWTAWSATSNDPDVLVGKRDFNGDGYLIVANTGAATQVTFALSGLSPAPVEAWNFLENDAFVALVQGGQFTTMLPAHSTAVYRLSSQAYPEILQNVGMESTGSPLPNWGGVGSAFSLDGTTKYSGSYSARIYNANTAYDTTYLQRFAPLETGATYRFTAMVKTSGVTKDSPSNNYTGAVIQLFVGGGINDFLPMPGLSGTGDWQLVQKVFTAPGCSGCGVNDWYVRLRLFSASGTVWFDNVSLKKISP